jgi:hypothetical protein
MVGRQRRAVAWLLGLLLAVSGLACTSTHKVDTSGREADTREACFDSSRAESFSALHEMFVYVRVGTKEHYLLTLDRTYPDLPFAIGITISDTFSRICSGAGARLNFVHAGVPVSARILRVEAVASKDAAEHLVRARTGAQPR